MLSHLSVALIVAAAVAAPTTQVQPLYTYGHAAYTYGPLHCTGNPCDVVPSCNKAHWVADIEAFNNDTSISDAKISTVYSYGGDVEFWPVSPSTPDACHAPAVQGSCNYTSYYDKNNEKAAAVYAEAQGVEQVVALLDARLDGWDMITIYNNNDACQFGDFYPNLNNLSAVQLDNLAKQTAKLFCADANLGGIQVDLEPYQDPYKQSLEVFLSAMVKEFTDQDSSNGCRDEKHPQGRTASYFTFAHRTRDDFWTTLMGENGYFVFSGYDLNPKNEAFEYNTVDEFGANLIAEIPEIKRAIANGGKFTLALPIAASCHEYEHYIPMHGEGCGPACQPYDSGATMAQYVQKMMDILTADNNHDGLFTLTPGGQFLGLSFWVWTYDMTYPPMKWFNNLFLPATPSVDVLTILKRELPKLEPGYMPKLA